MQSLQATSFPVSVDFRRLAHVGVPITRHISCRRLRQSACRATSDGDSSVKSDTEVTPGPRITTDGTRQRPDVPSGLRVRIFPSSSLPLFITPSQQLHALT